jgi:hypothetical protein
MTATAKTLLVTLAALLVGGCGSKNPVPSPAARQSLEAIGAGVPVELNVPPHAIIRDGVASVVLAPGFGPSRPVPGRGQLLGLAFIAYADDGKVLSVSPFVLQEYDTSRAGWRSVLGQMVAGEVRRVWVHESGQLRVYDVELQSIGEAPKRDGGTR